LFLNKTYQVKKDKTRKKRIRRLPPRSMIPEAVLREFPAKTRRKHTVSGWNPPENARNPMIVSGCRFYQVPAGTGILLS
jgi:hypothetical protein